MVSLTNTHTGEFVGFYDSEGEAIVQAAVLGLAAFRIDNPFREDDSPKTLF